MEINTQEELTQLVNHSDALLLYFYSDNCAPCRSLRPKVQEMMGEEFGKMKLAMINAEKNPALAAAYQAFGLPVLLLFFEGKEFLRYSKYVSIAELRESIGRIYTLYYS